MNWPQPFLFSLVVVLTTTAIGGSIDSYEWDAGPLELKGFQATYREMNWSLDFHSSFVPLDEVMDADGQIFESYLLEIRNDHWTRRTYLDEALVPFREDLQQPCAPDACIGANWEMGRFPNWLGLDIPHQVAQDGTAWYMHGTEQIVVQVETEEVEEGTWYRILPEAVPPGHEDLFTASYLFNSDQTAPLKVVNGPEEDPDWTLVRVNYEEGAPLPPIDNPRRVPEPIDPLPVEGMMFPGEEEDTFGIGYSHRQLVEGLAQYEWIFGEGMMRDIIEEGGCIIDYVLYPDDTSTGLTGVGFVDDVLKYIESRRAAFKVQFQRPDEVEVHEWSADVHWGGPDPRFRNVEYRTKGWADDYCMSDYEKSWARLHIQEAYDQAEVYMADRHEFWAFQYSHLSYDNPPTSPEDGWNLFFFLYNPEGATGFALPYQVVINGDRSELIDVEMAPEDFWFPPAYGPSS